MIPKRETDDLLSHLEASRPLSEAEARWLEALAGEGVDPATATRLVGSLDANALSTLVDLLRASKREREDMAGLARQFREDLHTAEAELNRLGREVTDLGKERDQQALEALTHKSARGEERSRHQEELNKARTREEGLREAGVRHQAAVDQLSARISELEQRIEEERIGVSRLLESRAAEARDRAVASVESEWGARIDKLRREHADALSALRLERAEEIRALNKAHEAAKADLNSEQIAALRRASEERWARMQQTQDELREHYEARLSAMQARATEAREEAERGYAAALEAQQAALQAEKDRALASLETEAGGRLERLRREQSQVLAAMEEEHRNEREALQRTHQEVVAGKEKDHEAARRGLKDESGAMRAAIKKLQDETQRQHEASLAEAAAKHSETLKRTLEEQAAARLAAEASLRQETGQALAALEAEWKEKFERQRRGHAQLLAALRAEQERQERAARTPAAPLPRLPVMPSSPAPAPPVVRPAVVPGATPQARPAAAAPERPQVARPEGTTAVSSLPVAAPPVAAPPATTHPTPLPSVEPSEGEAQPEPAVGETGRATRGAPARAALSSPLPWVVGGVAVILLVATALGVGVWRSRAGRTEEAASVPAAVATLPAPVATETAPASVDAPVSNETGTVDIFSTPAGATVGVAGRAAGLTPVTNLEVRVGTYPVLITRAGHQQWEGFVVVEAGKKAEIRADLKPLPSPAEGANR
jgi:hypothetical protein